MFIRLINTIVKPFGFSIFYLGVSFCVHAQIQVSTSSGTGYDGVYWLQSVPPGTPLGPAGISFVIENTNLTPVTLTALSSHLGPVDGNPAGTPISTKLFYSTSLSGAYNLSSGWTQIATGSATVPASPTILPVISGISFNIPAQTQYRFVLEASTGLHFSYSPTPTPNSFTSGGVVLKVGNFQISGQNVGFAGVSPTGNTGGTFLGGSITLLPACSGSPNPGNTLPVNFNPSSPCIPFTLSLQNNPNVSGLTYQWQYRSPSIGVNSFTNITGATASTLNTTLVNVNSLFSIAQNVQVYFRANVTCSGITTSSNENTVTNITTQYIFIGNGAWTTPSNWFCGMIPQEPVNSLVQINGNATKSGLNIGASGNVTISAANSLTLTGNLINAGTLSGPGQLIMDNGTSTVTNTGNISTSFLLNSDTMTLLSNLSPASLHLTNDSKVILGNFDLNMSANSLTGGNATNFIVTNGTGRLTRTVSNTSVLFPIGINPSSYTPMTIKNTGVTDVFRVRVEAGVPPAGRIESLTDSSVMRSWRVTESVLGGSNAEVVASWTQAEEGPDFQRSQSYIAVSATCPQPYPPNCPSATGYNFYDTYPASAATGPVLGLFSQSRNNLTSFDNRTFIVTSQVHTFLFTNATGNGNWNDVQNWMFELKPPVDVSGDIIIGAGMEVIIDPISGQCNVNAIVRVLPGGKLTVKPGKILNTQ